MFLRWVRLGHVGPRRFVAKAGGGKETAALLPHNLSVCSRVAPNFIHIFPSGSLVSKYYFPVFTGIGKIIFATFYNMYI